MVSRRSSWTSPWFGLPNEIKLEILKHCFRDTKINYKHHSFGNMHPKIFNVLRASKNFAPKDMVDAAMLSTATVVLYNTLDIRAMFDGLTVEDMGQIRHFQVSMPAIGTNAFLEPRLERTHGLFPNLKSIEIALPGCEQFYLNISPKSDLFLLAVDASERESQPEFDEVHRHVKLRTGKWLPAPEDLLKARSQFNLEAEHRAGFIDQEYSSNLFAQAMAESQGPNPLDLLYHWQANLIIDLLRLHLPIEIKAEWPLTICSNVVGLPWPLSELKGTPIYRGGITFSTKDMCARFDLDELEVVMPQAISEDFVKNWGLVEDVPMCL